ncbi:hypothetical protein AC1031_011950 [Aphanomyces cochlioides]|nr:hypothetical protein AC1031_011950 [Aphanomyces cochlioides]
MDAVRGDDSVPSAQGLKRSSATVEEGNPKRSRTNNSATPTDSKQPRIEEKPSWNTMIVPAPTAAIPEPNQGELMAIHSIIQKIKSLDWKLVEKELEKGMVYLGDASLSDWKAFVTSEDQQLKSKNMESIDGKIFFVELPSREHATYVGRLLVAINNATHTQDDFVEISLDAYQTNIRRLEPDLCLIPRRPPYNVQLPPGLDDWGNFHTVKWEVAWSKSWANLDWKANQWAMVDTVVYIICIKLDPHNPSYKVHHVVHHGVQLPEMIPLPIAPPNTVIQLDSRLVLQLPATSPLPPNFPPQLDIDLYAPLTVALQ